MDHGGRFMAQRKDTRNQVGELPRVGRVTLLVGGNKIPNIVFRHFRAYGSMPQSVAFVHSKCFRSSIIFLIYDTTITTAMVLPGSKQNWNTLVQN